MRNLTPSAGPVVCPSHTTGTRRLEDLDDVVLRCEHDHPVTLSVCVLCTAAEDAYTHRQGTPNLSDTDQVSGVRLS